MAKRIRSRRQETQVVESLKSEPSLGQAPATAKSQRAALIALGLLFLFVVFFFRFDLSTSPVIPELGRKLTRLDLLLASPELLLSTLVPDDPNQPPLFTVNWLHDRVPLLAVAGLLALSALGYGKLGLRLLGLQRVLSRSERVFFAYGIGTSWLSLVTLVAGLAGFLNRPGLVGFSVLGPLIEGLLLLRSTRKPNEEADEPRWPSATSESKPRGIGFVSLCALALAPFVLLMLLGAMLPPMEFDVREYHLQGPKEFFEQGRISFLPHNVYANMPFGTEMLSLLSMVVMGDWWWGLWPEKRCSAYSPCCVLSGFGRLGHACSVLRREPSLRSSI